MRETPVAARAFETYYSLGEDRSLRVLADKTGTKLGQLGVWSKEHHWQRRVIERDAKEAERKRKKQDADRDAMNARHAQIGITQQLKAIEQIERLIKAQSFGSYAAVQLLKLATDIERLARGEPETVNEQRHTGQIIIQIERDTTAPLALPSPPVPVPVAAVDTLVIEREREENHAH